MNAARLPFSRQIIYQWEFVLLIALTVLMLIATSAFFVPGIVDHPQFAVETDRQLLADFMRQSWLIYLAYYSYFAINSLWAFVLMLILWKFYYHQHRMQPRRFTRFRFRIFSLLAFSAFLLDVFENYTYAISFEHPGMITQVKIAVYAGVALMFADSFLRTVVRNFLGTLRRFLRSSIYSLIILAIIGVFLPRASQVNSIVVDLYLEPWNMFLLLILSFTFAITLTHYPSYINIDKESRTWYISRLKLFGLLGIVHYKLNNDKKEQRQKKEGSYNYLLRLLGVCYYVGLFYMIAYTSQVNYDWPFRMSYFALSLLLVGAMVLYRLSSRKDGWYDYVYELLSRGLPDFYDNDYTPRNQRNMYLPEEIQEKKRESPYHLRPNESVWNKKLRLIHRPIQVFFGLLIITALAHVGLFAQLIGTESPQRYNEITIVLSLICIVLQLFSFVYFRSVRSLLRFSCYHPRLPFTADAFVRMEDIRELHRKDPDAARDELERQRSQVRGFFGQHPCRLQHPPHSLFSHLGFSKLSSNLGFLWTNFATGTAIFLFLLVLNLNAGLLFTTGILPSGSTLFTGEVLSYLAIPFNTLLLILFYLFTYYGMFTALTKNYIYYRQEQSRKSMMFVNALLLLALVLGFSFYQTRRLGNNIYELTPVERHTEEEISLKEYAGGLHPTAPRYYIGAYGGGMKANAWTMSVLNELQMQQPEFMGRTVGISGASGGTMGWMNYAAIHYANPDRPGEWGEVIRRVSTENILSMDISQMLGRDVFYYLFNPGLWPVGNRSESAMDRYAHLTRNTDVSHGRIPYRSFWSKLYQKWDRRYPVLIANTTNVKGNHGMAVSVSTPDRQAKRLLYQGADDILEIDSWDDCSTNKAHPPEDIPCSKTLAYYDAASTSNRFPVLSPAAKIEGKGNYNDGGIYENSGLLSVFKLMQAINYHEKVSGLRELKQDHIFVNIVNDKDLYIRYYVHKRLGCQARKLNNYSETGSLLSSVAATEMLPTYIKSVLSDLDSVQDIRLRFRSIYLPHRFTAQDVKDLMGRQLVCGGSTEQIDARLFELAQENNRTIDSVLRSRLRLGGGRIPVVEPAVSRVMAEPAYDFMHAMLGHPITRDVLKEITGDSQN